MTSITFVRSRPWSCVLAVAVLTGCGASPKAIDTDVQVRMAQHKATPLETKPAVVESPRNLAPVGRSIDTIDDRQAVNIDVANTNLYDLALKLSKRMGYGLSAMSSVDITKTVTISVKAATPAHALRQLAWQAGYVAVINDQDKSVILTREATMVFKVPSDDLKKILNTNFKYGGSPVGGSGGAGGASGGTSAGAGQATATAFAPVAAEMSVEGSYSNSPKSFQSFIEDLAGSNARVQVYLEAGLISVRSNGQALKRVHDFLSRYAFDARRQIEINARVVEVSLSNEFRYGIQWDKVLNAAGTKRLGLNAKLAAAVQPTTSFTFSSESITSVIQALESLTNVDVTSTPQMVITNNSSGVIFDGVQKPIVTSISQTTSGATAGGAGQVTITGSASYASDGIQMAIHASILDDDNAVLTIVPSTVTLGELKKLLNDQIQMFEQSVRNGGQRIAIRSNETLVISGNRYNRSNSADRGVPGLVHVPGVGGLAGTQSKDTSARQTVIIMNARILRPDPMEIVFSESI